MPPRRCAGSTTPATGSTSRLLAPDATALDALIERGRHRNEQIVADLEAGRDRLLELTSFDIDAAQRLRDAIIGAEQNRQLEHFMVDAFERAGLDLESLGNRSYVARIGPDYHRPFSGFIGQEMAVTFDRETGLEHPERALLSWDHPMVRDTVDTLLAHETGNASVTSMGSDAPGLLLEALYVAEPTLPRELRADRFFPPTPIHVVLDISGQEAEFDRGATRDGLRRGDPGILEHPQVAERLPELLEQAREIAEVRAPATAVAAVAQMRRELQPMVARLTELAAVNESVSTAELEAARTELATLDAGLAGVRVRLEGLRLIVLTPE